MALTLWNSLLLLLVIPVMVDTQRSKPRASEDTVIIVTDWAQPGRILNVSLKHMNFSALPVSDVLRPVAVDYDPADDNVYWTDVFLKQIRSTNMKTKRDSVLVQLNASATPDGIAVDAEERIVFYTDAGNNMLSSVDLNSRQSKVILQDDLQEPRAIIIHREIRKIYWTDWGQTPRIESSDYDGAGRKTVVSTNLSWPNGLALDKYNERLYWCDAKKSVIETIRLDGSDRKVVLSEPTAHYFDLFYHQGVIYFTDWQRQKALLHVPACGGMVGSLASGGFNKLAGLHVISRSNSGQNYTLSECLAKCSHCLNVNNCDFVTGRCPGGCKDGWTGDRCSAVSVSVKPVTTLGTTKATSWTAGSETWESSGQSEVTGQLEVTTELREETSDDIHPAVGAAVDGTQSWSGLSFAMTIAVALGCFSVLLFVAIIILVIIHRVRRKKEKEFSNLAWARQQAFTNNTYTLMAGDTEDRSQVYLVPLDDPLKSGDDPDHLYEDIDELKK